MIVIIVTKREIQSYLFVKKLRVFFFVRLFYLATVNGENLIIEVTNKYYFDNLLFKIRNNNRK